MGIGRAAASAPPVRAHNLDRRPAHQAGTPGLVGRLGISAAAILVMPLLAWQKRRPNRAIQSPGLRADISETLTCAYMAGTTLVGVALSTLLGWWWVEYVAAFALLFFIARESWEALEAAREGNGRYHDEYVLGARAGTPGSWARQAKHQRWLHTVNDCDRFGSPSRLQTPGAVRRPVDALCRFVECSEEEAPP